MFYENKRDLLFLPLRICASASGVVQFLPYGFVEGRAIKLHLCGGVILVLAGSTVIQAMVRQAQPGQIRLGTIGGIVVQMCNLTLFFPKISYELET